MPAFKIGQIEIKNGKYIFQVDHPDKKCELKVYRVGDYSKKAKPLVSKFKAACMVRNEVENKVLVEVVRLSSDSREGIIYYKTPDSGIKKTRIILIPVTMLLNNKQ